MIELINKTAVLLFYIIYLFSKKIATPPFGGSNRIDRYKINKNFKP
jgi:hypothetical protein